MDADRDRVAGPHQQCPAGSDHPLIGWSAATLADADDERISALAAHFAEWGRVFTEAGFSAMAARIVDQMAVASRVLAAPHGERALTDLLQVAAICNRQVMDQGWGLSELTEWLTDRVADIASHARSDDQVRRLESDAQAVQIMTVHASKGLQFPIVYLPFAWDSLHTPRRRHDHVPRRDRCASSRRGRQGGARPDLAVGAGSRRNGRRGTTPAVCGGDAGTFAGGDVVGTRVRHPHGTVAPADLRPPG